MPLDFGDISGQIVPRCFWLCIFMQIIEISFYVATMTSLLFGILSMNWELSVGQIFSCSQTLVMCQLPGVVSWHDMYGMSSMHGMTWLDMSWWDMTCHRMTLQYMSGDATICFILMVIFSNQLLYHDLAWPDRAWHNMTWHDMMVHNMAQNDITRYGVYPGNIQLPI